MAEEATPGTRLLADEQRLRRGRFETEPGLREHPPVADEERLGHVDPVEPHLVRVLLLVPEAARRVPGEAVEPLAKPARGPRVLRVPCLLVKEEHEVPRLDPIQVVPGSIVPEVDAPVFAHVGVHPSSDVVQVPRVPGVAVHLRDPVQDDPRRVLEPLVADGLGVRPSREHAVREPDRERLLRRRRGRRDRTHNAAREAKHEQAGVDPTTNVSRARSHRVSFAVHHRPIQPPSTTRTCPCT